MTQTQRQILDLKRTIMNLYSNGYMFGRELSNADESEKPSIYIRYKTIFDNLNNEIDAILNEFEKEGK